jgi:predicted nucleic acid-binding protein
MIILDTNVISEIIRSQPNKNVIEWLQAQRVEEVFTTVIAEAELFKGIELMPLERDARPFSMRLNNS